MKKALKTYRWAWVAIITATIVTIAVMIKRTSHHDLAADPYKIEKIVKVDLPDVAFVESENNLNRGASRWDVYIHQGQFAEKLSEEAIKTMEDLCATDFLHWSKNIEGGYYTYSCQGGIDELYYVTCNIYDSHFNLTYEVDETEGIFVLMPLFVTFMILFAWGIALFIQDK